jgi:hypothetical protein
MVQDIGSFHLTMIMPDLKYQYSTKAGIIEHILSLRLPVFYSFKYQIFNSGY